MAPAKDEGFAGEFVRALQREWADVRCPDRIPEKTRIALHLYANEGRPLGGFLRSVIADEPFSDVVAKADPFNCSALAAISEFVYNELPAEAWGSEEKYNQWVRQDGLTSIDN